MSYKIRYGPPYDRRRDVVWNTGLRWKIGIGALVLICLAGAVSPVAGESLRGIFCRGPVTGGEQAVAAFARALRMGEGWYHGLAVWCAWVLFGPV